jgi:hypothetical protein
VDEKGHEAKKEAYKEGAEEKGVIGQIGDTISNAYNFVAEKVSGSYPHPFRARKKISCSFLVV